jgi:hypothetical protein
MEFDSQKQKPEFSFSRFRLDFKHGTYCHVIVIIDWISGGNRIYGTLKHATRN